VIPKQLREAMQIKPGDEFHVFQVGKVLELVPAQPLDQLRGIARGLKLDDIREKQDRSL
jgi:AbrB family looped-hinge helix DNA binding protein